MNIFFCDIRGTFDGSHEEREEQLKRFVANLQKLMQIDGLNQLVFSFVSTDEMDYVKTVIEELKPYLVGTNIVLGPQMAYNEILINDVVKPYFIGKTYQMMKYIDGEDLKNIYFADDTLLHHNILKFIISKEHPNVKLKNFVLGNSIKNENIFGISKRGIVGLNCLLEDYSYVKTDLGRSFSNTLKAVD